jgi:shikimate dehydrogenase
MPQKNQPDQYGVVGHPVAHSRSPFIHGLFARQTGQDLVYRLYDVKADAFREDVGRFFRNGGCGLNVTVPHKAAAAKFADELSARALRAGAANVLMRRGERVLGDNTDGAGLVRDLTRNLGIDLHGQRILLLGAGGATRGVLGPLLQAEPAELVVANRTAPRARELAHAFEDVGPVSGCGFEELPLRAFDLVINGTSAGLAGEMPPISAPVVGPTTICYDMSYARGDTPFTKWAWQLGAARAVQGWGMLVEQAADSFEIWRGVRPDTAPALEVLRVEGG